jgi:YVTN family beta-propeller protein
MQRKREGLLVVGGLVVFLAGAGCSGSDTVSPPASVPGHPAGISDSQVPLSGSPYGIAVTAAGRILVAQIGSNTIASGTLASESFDSTFITVGVEPPHVAVNPAGTRAFATNQFGSSLSVVDLQTNLETMQIPLHGNGFNVIVSRDGAEVYATTDTGWTYVISATSLTKLDSFPAGPVANGLAIPPSGPLLYVSARDGQKVTIYNTATRKIIDSLVTGGRPQRMAVSRDGGRLFIADEILGLDVWNLNTKTRDTSVAMSAYSLGLSPDGKRLYITAPTHGEVREVHASTYAILRTIPVGGMPRNVAFDRSGAVALVTNELGWVDFLR